MPSEATDGNPYQVDAGTTWPVVPDRRRRWGVSGAPGEEAEQRLGGVEGLGFAAWLIWLLATGVRLIRS